jgi:hypothetical protein
MGAFLFGETPMAQQTVNSNSTQPLGIPNTGTGTDQGDTWDQAVTKINANFTELYSGGSGARAYAGLQTFNDGITVGGALTQIESGMTVNAGLGTGSYAPAGMLSRTLGPVASAATNTSQTLASYTLPANTLQSVGQEIEVVAWGTTAGNAASKSMTLNIGGATYNTGSQTGSGYAWKLTGQYIKQSGDAQNYYFSGAGSSSGGTGGVVAPKAGTDTSVDTGTIAINCVVTDASAATGDITLLGFTVEFFG